MIVLGLDLSTHTGWAVLSDSKVLDYGCVECDKIEKDLKLSEDFFFVNRATHIALEAMELICKFNPDFIYIEQTNLGRARDSQKQLEFIHCRLLEFIGFRMGGVFKDKVRYIDTSCWRKLLEIRLDKVDKKNNKLVREGKKRGKVTSKHLAVRWANQEYTLELKLKDNDIADALAVCTSGLMIELDNERLGKDKDKLIQELDKVLKAKR